MRSYIFALSALAATAAAKPVKTAAANAAENRTIDEIYQAALKEGGVVTLWHGGDEKGSQDGLKQRFEQRFPGMTLNVTVDLSKYHDGRLDDQIASKNIFVDSIILQTLHDYPRWEKEGALLHYKPRDFDKIAPVFKQENGAYYGYQVYGWTSTWNPSKYNGTVADFADALRPEFKDKLALTYPNDDDAVLFAFDLVIQKLGVQWLDKLIAQNPTWLRGTATPRNQVALSSTPYVATFATGGGTNTSRPTDAPYVTWPQTAAILKDAPHPEGAKLLHSYLLSPEFQFSSSRWNVRTDAPAGFPNILNETNTDVLAFLPWMEDRARVERLRFWIEQKIGTAQGLSPLDDDM